MTRLYAAIAFCLIAALVVSGVALHHMGYKAGQADTIASYTAKADKVAAQQEAKTVQADTGAKAATDTGHITIAANTAATQVVTRTITRIVHDAPSPVACVLRPDSLRTLQDAADSANHAAQGVVR